MSADTPAEIPDDRNSVPVPHRQQSPDATESIVSASAFHFPSYILPLSELPHKSALLQAGKLMRFCAALVRAPLPGTTLCTGTGLKQKGIRIIPSCLSSRARQTYTQLRNPGFSRMTRQTVSEIGFPLPHPSRDSPAGTQPEGFLHLSFWKPGSVQIMRELRTSCDSLTRTLWYYPFIFPASSLPLRLSCSDSAFLPSSFPEQASEQERADLG